MSSNCLVFHTSGGISSSPAAYLFLIFLRTESSSSDVNGPSLMSNCLLIILVIGSCVTFGGFPRRFSKCCFHRCILSCWFAAFNFALVVLFLLLTSFIVRQVILDCLSIATQTLPFHELQHWCIRKGSIPFSGLFHFTLDPYIIILSVKENCIKYH